MNKKFILLFSFVLMVLCSSIAMAGFDNLNYNWTSETGSLWYAEQLTGSDKIEWDDSTNTYTVFIANDASRYGWACTNISLGYDPSDSWHVRINISLSGGRDVAVGLTNESDWTCPQNRIANGIYCIAGSDNNCYVRQNGAESNLGMTTATSNPRIYYFDKVGDHLTVKVGSNTGNSGVTVSLNNTAHICIGAYDQSAGGTTTLTGWINYTGNDPYTPPVNLSITAIDYFTELDIGNLSAIITGDGFYGNYSSTSGTILTNISSNSTMAYNITVGSNESGGYFDEQYYYNISLGASFEARLYQSRVRINAYELITDTLIKNFNVTSNSSGYQTYNATCGTQKCLEVGVPEGNWISYYMIDLLLRSGEYNISVMSEDYFNTSLNFTVSNLDNITVNVSFFDVLFNVTAYDFYNTSSINNFSVQINNTGNSYSETFHSSSLGIAQAELISSINYNVYVYSNESGGYFLRNFSQYDITTHLNASLWQYVLNMFATDALLGTEISSFNVTNGYASTIGSSGFASLKLNVDNHLINISDDAYNSSLYNITATARTIYNISLNLSPYINFTILAEKTSSPFRVENTTSTTLLIYCDEQTLEYNFTNYIIRVPVSCRWDFMKLDVAYSDQSYYRTLIPAYTERSIVWYGIDLLTDLAVQIILKINDLTGQYSDGIAILKKYISGEDTTVLSQEFDLEDKVVAYLIKDGLYTLSVRNNNGEERNLGYLIADSAGEKTITIPEIDYIPDTVFAANVNWRWYKEDTLIRLIYNDTSSYRTQNISYRIYNGSNTSQLLYFTSSANVSLISFSYTSDVNSSYLACFSAYNENIGNLSECKAYFGSTSVGTWGGFDDDGYSSSKITTWLSAFLMLAAVMIFGSRFVKYGMTLACFLMFMFIQWGWFNLGAAYNYMLLGLGVFLTIMMFYREARDQQ